MCPYFRYLVLGKRIICIAYPHIRHENIDTVRKVIKEIKGMQPTLVLSGGDFPFHG
jgi:hypothetical protein